MWTKKDTSTTCDTHRGDRSMTDEPSQKPALRTDEAQAKSCVVDKERLANVPAPLILVVDDDDDEDQLFLSRHILSSMGYRVQQAKDGEQALQVVGKFQPDLILVDINMPRMNGLEVCKQLSQNPLTADLPVVVVTHLDDPELVNQAFTSGAEDYVTKPINVTLLIRRISLILQNKNHTKQMKGTLENQSNALCIAKASEAEASQAKSVFLANMSHELRTPLHAILSFANMGIKKSTADKNLNLYFSRIGENGKHLMKLIDNLLDLSRLETGQMAFRLEETNVASIIKASQAELTNRLREKQIRMTLTIEPRLPMLMACQGYLQQAIHHLLDNALRFSSTGGLIEMTLTATTSAICFTVRDQGPGIPEDELTSIFGRFTQSSRTRNNAGGRGLGLALCQELIMIHGGHVTAANHAGGGAIFTLLLQFVNETTNRVAS